MVAAFGMTTGWALRLAVLVAVAAAALATGVVPAGAHAVLLESSPADGAEVEGGPERIELIFNEPMQLPATIEVAGPDGEPVEAGDVERDGRRIFVELEHLGTDGVYSVSWRAVSVDDHPVGGEFTFQVTGPQATSETDDGPPAAEQSSQDASADEQPTEEPGLPGDATTGQTSSDDGVRTADQPADPGNILWLLLGGAAVAALLAVAASAWSKRRDVTAP